MPCVQNAVSPSSPVGTGFGVQAFIREAQALDWAAGDQMLGHNLGRVFRLHVAIPDGIGINHYRGTVLALVEAAGLVDAHFAGQPGGFGQLLQLRVQLAGPVGGAGRPRRTFGPHIVADKDMAFKCWQVAILLKGPFLFENFWLGRENLVRAEVRIRLL
jgi:hypothetical protein